MSASAIRDALQTMFNAASFMGTANVAQHYGVLESTSGSCCVIETQALEQIEDTFDHTHQVDWAIVARFFSKDTGDPAGLGARTACMIDLCASTIRGDPTLQGTVERVTSLSIERELPPEGFITAGGQTWQETTATVAVEEWPDG